MKNQMAARNSRIAVSVDAPLLALVSGQLGENAGQPVAEAVSLELSRSSRPPPMEVSNVITRMAKSRTALVEKPVALWTAWEHGVALTSALNSARIAVAMVQLAHRRKPSPSLWRLNAVERSARQKMVKFLSKTAMSIAAHRTVKVHGASLVNAPLHVAMEIERKLTASPTMPHSVVRNASGKTVANSLKHALTRLRAQFIARVNGIHTGDIALQNVVSMTTRASKRSISSNSSRLSMVEMSVILVMLRFKHLRHLAPSTCPRSV